MSPTYLNNCIPANQYVCLQILPHATNSLSVLNESEYSHLPTKMLNVLSFQTLQPLCINVNIFARGAGYVSYVSFAPRQTLDQRVIVSGLPALSSYVASSQSDTQGSESTDFNNLSCSSASPSCGSPLLVRLFLPLAYLS